MTTEQLVKTHKEELYFVGSSDNVVKGLRQFVNTLKKGHVDKYLRFENGLTVEKTRKNDKTYLKYFVNGKPSSRLHPLN